jgi:hypothetical protein
VYVVSVVATALMMADCKRRWTVGRSVGVGVVVVPRWQWWPRRDAGHGVGMTSSSTYRYRSRHLTYASRRRVRVCKAKRAQ